LLSWAALTLGGETVQDVIISRVFDAPRNWCTGPFTDPAERHPMDSIYSEVIENEVLAGYQDAEGLPGADGAVRMEFRLEFHDEPDGRTRLDLRAAASSAEEQDGMREGWESSFTKLDQLLQG
jgi:uncharacterized protein YndB with AHSA1/START domain